MSAMLDSFNAPGAVVVVALLALGCVEDEQLVADSGAADAAVLDGEIEGADQGVAPDGCVPRTWYPDVDGDGAGDDRSPVRACERPEGYADNGLDPEPECATDDTDVCGVCAGPGPATWYSDEDGDGMGADGVGLAACVPPEGWVLNRDDPEPDCATNDTDICGICAGPGEERFYLDADGDGLGDPEVAADACVQPDGFVDNADDPEPNCETNDNDDCGVCAGPGAHLQYRDADGDGLGDPEESREACGAAEEGWAVNGDDEEPDCATNDTDACGVCGGREGDRDCHGDCFGEAWRDDCDLCVGGETGQEPAAVDTDGDGRPDACDECAQPNPARFIVQWNRVRPFNMPEEHGPYTFQIVLYENGDFRFQYTEIEPFGVSATIGWQLGAGVGQTLARDNDFVLEHRVLHMSPEGEDRYLVEHNRPLDWIDVTEVGRGLELGDDEVVSVELGFWFRLGGGRYDRVQVSSNGHLTFAGEALNFQNGQLPDDEARVMLAALWDDLNPGGGGDVFVYTAQPACEEDCNGVVGGFAVLDGCEVCVGGDTGRQPSENVDCTGACDGQAFLDDCGNCVGGDTGLEPAAECFPDLIVDVDYLASTLELTMLDAQDQCLVDEGCLGALGPRRIIRFGTRIANIGRADLVLGVPEEGVDHWIWDDCHSHFHYEAYADYALEDVETGEALPGGHKNGFAVIDIGVFVPEIAVNGCRGYNPRNQGITAGCQDTYGRGLPCQWIDVTDTEDGIYDIVVTTNPDRVIEEAHYGNNAARVRVRLAVDGLEVLDAE